MRVTRCGSGWPTETGRCPLLRQGDICRKWLRLGRRNSDRALCVLSPAEVRALLAFADAYRKEMERS
jgi:hypothetical protein